MPSSWRAAGKTMKCKKRPRRKSLRSKPERAPLGLGGASTFWRSLYSLAEVFDFLTKPLFFGEAVI
jgi:hypothetical protein